MLCSGFMDAGRANRRYVEPRLYPTSWVYSRNRQPHRHKHTTGLVGSTKIRSRGFSNTSSEKQTLQPSTCNLYRMLLVGEYPSLSWSSSPHTTHRAATCESCSTIGKGGDTTIPSPERSPKHPLLGIGLHDPLHGRQACPEPNSFHQGVGQICTR